MLGIKFEHGDGDNQQKEKDDFKDGDGFHRFNCDGHRFSSDAGQIPLPIH